jgi:chromosome segregation ATPase
MRKELENEIGSNRKEFEAMVRVMEDLESHLNAKTAREENIEVLMRENSKKTEEALMERDRATRRESNLIKTIEKLESDLKQSSYDTESKHNQLMENMRSKHQNISRSKDEEINDLSTKSTSLENQIERLERENRSYKNETTK